MKHRKSVLSAAIVTCLGFAVQAQAQDAAAPPPAEQEATEIATVTVVGIRGALQQSLETKRNSDAIIDVITAEDVGKFPATNVAEAMALIPGVTIDKAFGQGEKVSILGTDPALSRTLLNGQTVASADWYIADQPGRTFNYSLLAPQLVGKVEVYKTPEAHIDEGSIGGTVIISTRKPLDMQDRYTVSGQIGYLYNDRIGSGEPNVSFVGGWKNEAGNFGIMVSAQRDIENIRRDGIESYGTVTGDHYASGREGAASSFTPRMDWGAGVEAPAACRGACETTLRANLDAIAPNSISAHYFEQKRDRDTLSLALQFRPHEKLDIELNALDVKAGFDNISHSMFAFNGNVWNSLGALTDLTVEGGVITKASFKNALSVYDLINRQATVDTDSYDAKFTWSDESWSVSAHLGTSEAGGGTGRQVYGSFLNWGDYSYDISGGTPRLDFAGYNYGSAPARSPMIPGSPFTDPDAFRIDGGWGADPNDGSTWNTGWGGNIVTKPTFDREDYGQVDFSLRFNSPIHQVRFGYKMREHETGQAMSGVALLAVAGYGDSTPAEFGPRPLPDNYLSGFGNVGDLSNRFTIDGWALANHILSGAWLAPWQTMPEPGNFNDRDFVSNTWTVSEDINAGYVQADYSWNGFRGNIGFRYVKTESDSMGWQCTTVADCGPNAAGNNGVHRYEQVHVVRNYSDFLPNLNIAYDWNDVVFRFSAAKVMSRPNYGDMSNYLWLGPSTLTGGGGNPNLDPYRSTNIDASAEWYFDEGSILAGTLFYKDVGNYILTTTREEVHFNQSQGRDTVFVVSRPDNAGAAKIQGLSLNYQQNLARGFGILANYTYSDSSSESGYPVPWTSEHQYSLSPFFENDRWNARVTYSHRSEYFTQMDRGNGLVTDGYTSLDASVSFRINQYLSLAVDGMNLLDSEYYTYAQVPGVANTEKLVRGLYRTGSRYLASVRVRF